MRSVGGLCKKKFIITFGYCVLVSFSDMLVGLPKEARSAVFEQMDNGLISEWNDGVPEGTPSLDHGLAWDGRAVGFATSPVAMRSDLDGLDTTGSVLLNLDPYAVRRASGLLAFGTDGKSMPQPRALSATFSHEQRKMRILAAQVGLKFSRTASVAKAGLDQKSFVRLFTTMIHRESNFNVKAVSPAGASGLGQLMPGTARAMGVCDVFSGRDNLEGAARYLTQMLDEFASATLALAAYNAGPGAVQKYQGMPPYKETRQYVADIIHALATQPETDLTLSNSAELTDISDRDFELFVTAGATHCVHDNSTMATEGIP